MMTNSGIPPLRVLFLEGNAQDAAAVVELLARDAPDKFDITIAESLSRAQAVLIAQEFDAALVGLSLPDSSGVETVVRMRFAAPRVPIVVLSGSSDEGLALQTLHRGAQDYLVKGHADGQVIARVLRYAVERQGAEEELRRAHALLEQRVMERTAFLKVTNRRLSEEIAERRRAEEVLRKERDFSAAILDTVDAIVVVLDPLGRLVRCNRCCETITGYSESEIKGKYVWDVFLDPSIVDQIKPVFDALVKKKEDSKHENYWRVKNGTRRLIDWSNTVIVDDQQNAEYVIATGIDVTDRQHAEELHHQRMIELAHVSRLSTMGQMATEIAHELNQPLCAIASYGDTCLRMYESKNSSPDEVRRVLKEITSQAERAGEVIRRVRKFVRKDNGDRAPVSLNDVINDVVRLTQVEARWNQVTVSAQTPDFLPPVLADKILIEQVILNLVRNAIEAIAGAKAPRREITISTGLRDGATLEVSVEDSGPGIPPQGAEKLFQPFFTTKPQGMGMGLSLSRSIAVAHGGDLSVEPGVATGAKFRLVLPAIQRGATQ